MEIKTIGNQFNVITGDQGVLDLVPAGKDLDKVAASPNYRFNGSFADLRHLYEQAEHKGTESAASFYAAAKREYMTAAVARFYADFIGQVYDYVKIVRNGGQDYAQADAIVAYEDAFAELEALGHSTGAQAVIDEVKALAAGPLTRAEVEQHIAEIDGGA